MGIKGRASDSVWCYAYGRDEDAERQLFVYVVGDCRGQCTGGRDDEECSRSGDGEVDRLTIRRVCRVWSMSGDWIGI